MYLLPVLLFIIFNLTIINTVIASSCNELKNCSSCLETPECIWCIEKEVSAIHCRHISKQDTCSNEKNNIINQKSSFTVLDEEGIRIKPTKIRLQLRPNQPIKINFNYKENDQYPLDLYFLLDVSKTMEIYREELPSQLNSLVTSMKNLTSDIQVGFGSFVDKPELPFINTNFEAFQSDYPGLAIPYSFKNHLPITENTTLFTEKIKTIKSSGNIDPPEGTLDALMQVIVCTKQIGWRENVRHLIVVITDDTFHIAGDGKLAGIVDPNDGLCHLEDDSYTHALLQDYPSIGKINIKAKQYNIFTIFAVKAKVKDIYNKLSNEIENSFTGTLSNDSNVINILTNIYGSITDTVKIQHNFGNNFKVQIDSNCENFQENESYCRGVTPGKNIEFNAIITLQKCPKNVKTIDIFNINPSGLRENITIEIEYLCKCDCVNNEKNSAKCNKAGDLNCGICNCEKGKSGVNCECDDNNPTHGDINSCIKKNDTEICSKQGICKCGQCICNNNENQRETISGRYCECNNLQCLDDDNKICSKHGKCECGVCKCFPGWSGNKCECSENINTCRNPNGNNTLCSGESHGECKCSKCNCKSIDGHKYSGEYCEKCLTCPEQKCADYKHCVNCKVLEKEKYNEFECGEKCNIYTIHVVNKTNNLFNDTELSCSVRDDDGCVISFIMIEQKYEKTPKLLLYAYKNITTCVEFKSASLLLGILVPIGVILIAAIISVIVYKIIDELKFKAEYAKFVERQEKEIKHMNPLYSNPVSEVQNPLFGTNM